MLESADNHSNEHPKSFIGLRSRASFTVKDGVINLSTPQSTDQYKINTDTPVIQELQAFMNTFHIKDSQKKHIKFFGYTTYDAVQYFEDIDLQHTGACSIPEISYHLFQFLIEFDHHKKQITVYECLIDEQPSELEQILEHIAFNQPPVHKFKLTDKETSNVDASTFKHMVSKGKMHCQSGDVFQIVLSRQFAQKFKGDEFNVYRALRAINPSPYLFYFDYGAFKIFGSSPEAQLKVENGKAILNPIAGTYKRTGDDETDQKLAKALQEDSKENAEHNMLVDLARNDLSKHGKDVSISSFKAIHYYSHVIHMVSEIQANINPKDALHIFADTFPAGTLSGAPKYKAIQLIDQYENQSRGFYGGSIGYFGLDGSVNQAITIRSFLSQNQTLYSQAGAGVVIDSKEENELEEVNHKLKALKHALNLAETL